MDAKSRNMNLDQFGCMFNRARANVAEWTDTIKQNKDKFFSKETMFYSAFVGCSERALKELNNLINVLESAREEEK